MVPCAFYTPRISLEQSKLVICACHRSSTGTAVSSGAAVRGAVGVGVGYGYTGWGEGTTQPGYHGIARAQPVSQQRYLRPPQALQALPGPSAHLGLLALSMPSWSQYRRDSGVNILKLVIIPECHRYLMMRPAIVPVSKTGPKCMTLNS